MEQPVTHIIEFKRKKEWVKIGVSRPEDTLDDTIARMNVFKEWDKMANMPDKEYRIRIV
jgi:hypothetical protein